MTGSPPAARHGGLALAELFQGRLGLVLLSLVCQTAIVGLGLYGPFLTLHARDMMGLSKREINVLYALAYIVAACASPWAGTLAPERPAGPFSAPRRRLGGLRGGPAPGGT